MARVSEVGVEPRHRSIEQLQKASSIDAKVGVDGAVHAKDVSVELKVFQGDAFDLATTLSKDSVDVVITSPPYWGMRTYDLDHNQLDHNQNVLDRWIAKGKAINEVPPYEWYRDAGGILGLEPLPEWYPVHLTEIFDRLKEALRPSGSMWVDVGDTYFARWSSIRPKGRQGLGENPRLRRRTPMGGFRQEKNLFLLPARFAIEMQSRRWILRNDLIWFKPNVIPGPEKDRLRLSHEHFFHFVKRPKAGREKYYYDLSKVENSAYDVVCYNVKAGDNKHSATFPEALIEPRILSSCPEGGVLLDPFCGTGRALAVALKNARHAIGFELSPEYANAASQISRKFPTSRQDGVGNGQEVWREFRE